LWAASGFTARKDGLDPLNESSKRVAERLGETIEGETEIGGHRLIVYGIRR